MTLTRREWLRNAALLAVGAVGIDQLEILEHLTHRRNWSGWRGAAQPIREGYIWYKSEFCEGITLAELKATNALRWSRKGGLILTETA